MEGALARAKAGKQRAERRAPEANSGLPKQLVRHERLGYPNQLLCARGSDWRVGRAVCFTLLRQGIVIEGDLRNEKGWRDALLFWLIPGATVVALLVACVIISGKKPLWYDEVLTRTLLTDPSMRHMLGAMAAGAEAAPPFYHFLARVWIFVAGSGVLALRALSWGGFSLAAILSWLLVRSEFGPRASALALLAVFCGSSTVHNQVAEIRFYGVLTCLVALALYLGALAMRKGAFSKGLLIATTLTHAALVLCHFFGFAYSGAILGAVVLWDYRVRRFRPLLYWAVAVGWLAYTPWVASTISQASMGSTGNWTPVPRLSDFIAAFGFQITFLPALFLLVLALIVLRPHGVAEQYRPVDLGAPIAARLSLHHLAFALIAVIPVVFAFSRISVSIFLDRYLLPAALGFLVVLAEVFTRLGIDDVPLVAEKTTARLAHVALIGGMLSFPVYRALSMHDVPTPGAQLQTMDADGIPVTRYPVVIESNLIFLPFTAYAAPTSPFYFALDSAAAADPRAMLGAGMENRGMRVFKRQGYFAHNIVDGKDFLCNTLRFAVVDDPHHFWFERRVLGDSAFLHRQIGAFSNMHDSYVVHFIERRPGQLPAHCSPLAPG